VDKLKSIVVAIDMLDEGRYAADRAAIVAKAHRAHLSLVYVIAPAETLDKLVDDTRRRLNEVAAEIGKTTGLVTNACVKVGPVLDEILSMTEDADLLVLGVPGSNPPQDTILGTTAERLLGKCKRPMLVAKCPSKIMYEHVIVPVDFSPYSAPALNMARQIAPNARITILHAVRVPSEAKLSLAGLTDEAIRRYSDEERQEAVKKIEAMIHSITDNPSLISFAVERGKGPEVILAKETDLSADLIVIGKHGQSMIEELLFGSTTRYVLVGSRCDVLIVQEKD
jgi:nucleotide-binding universal stress UspA family protein